MADRNVTELDEVTALLTAAYATLESAEWEKSEELGAMFPLLRMARSKTEDVLNRLTLPAQEVSHG